MGVKTLLFTCVAVISVSGQYLDPEYILDSVPLPIRRRLNSDRYEIQASVGQEIERQGGESARSSNQGRRHIENQNRDNIHNEQHSRNVNNYEVPFENVGRLNNNGAQQVYYNNQFARIQEQTQEEYVRESNINRDTEHQNNKNNGATTVYDSNLKTNLKNTHLRQNIQTSTGRNSPNSQRSYPSNDNLRTNLPTHTRVSENSRDNGDSENLFNKNKTTEVFAGRAIAGNNYNSNQNLASMTFKDDREESQRANTKTRRVNNNRNENKQSTESSRRITVKDKVVTGSTKSTQDNELAYKTHSEGRSGTKEGDGENWIFSDGKGKSTVLPSVDDRAAFVGDKCPAGQVRFNNMCVNTD